MAILAIVTVVLLLIAIPIVMVNRDVLFHRSGARPAEAPLPFLLFPVSPEPVKIVPAAVATVARHAEPAFEDLTDDEAVTDGAIANVPSDASTPAEAAASREPTSEAASRRSFEPRTEPVPRWPRALSDDEYENSIASDATMVFNRPVDEAVQILPGRLRVLSGENTGQELRLFNRLGDPPRIVVGREPGPPHERITLRSPTVSRRHARMELVDGCWTITNLSTTNPVLVNDRALDKDGATRKLADGDRIELGEVALRFLAS